MTKDEAKMAMSEEMKQEFRSKCGLMTAEPAIKRSLDAMVNRSINRTKAEMIQRSEALTTEIRMLVMLILLLAAVSGLLAVLGAYVSATVAMCLTMIPSTMFLTRYDRREIIRRKLFVMNLKGEGGRQ